MAVVCNYNLSAIYLFLRDWIAFEWLESFRNMGLNVPRDYLRIPQRDLLIKIAASTFKRGHNNLFLYSYFLVLNLFQRWRVPHSTYFVQHIVISKLLAMHVLLKCNLLYCYQVCTTLCLECSGNNTSITTLNLYPWTKLLTFQ